MAQAAVELASARSAERIMVRGVIFTLSSCQSAAFAVVALVV